MNPEINQQICPACGKSCIAMVKESGFENTILETQNLTFVCVNPNCSLRIDLDKVSGWRKIYNKGRS